MATLEFAGPSVAQDSAPGANTARLLNCYREAVQQGGLTRYIVRPVLGQTVIGDLGSVIQRGIEWVDGRIYSAASGNLYRIRQNGNTNLLGAITDSAETSISGNTGNVTIAAGGKYYVYDGSTVTEPTAGAFTDFGSVETLANYTLLTERNGRKFQWSAIGDPTSLDPLDFATTESRDDNNIRGMELSGLYWIFKERSIEIWYPTGIATDAFRRVQGGVNGTGLRGYNLITKARDSLFFLGSDGIVYFTAGQGIQPVSTRTVEDSIADFTPTHCFYYEDNGHKFCVVRFSDRPAWVYDIATNEWHERSEGREHEEWGVIATAKSSGGTLIGVGELGEIVRMDRTVTDRGGELFRRMVGRTLRLDNKRFRVKSFEVYGAYGENDSPAPIGFYLPLAGGYLGIGDPYLFMGEQGSPEPGMMVSFSKDRGRTFSAERFAEMGSQGEYDQRAQFRALGQYRSFTPQIDITAPYEMPIYSDASVEVV